MTITRHNNIFYTWKKLKNNNNKKKKKKKNEIRIKENTEKKFINLENKNYGMKIQVMN